MASNHPGPAPTGSANRGFVTVDPERQRETASPAQRPAQDPGRSRPPDKAREGRRSTGTRQRETDSR